MYASKQDLKTFWSKGKANTCVTLGSYWKKSATEERAALGGIRTHNTALRVSALPAELLAQLTG